MNNLLKAIVLAASWLTAQPAFAALNVMACENLVLQKLVLLLLFHFLLII